MDVLQSAAPTKIDETETLYVGLAREIAINFRPLDELLVDYKVTPQQWATISKHPRFVTILEQQVLEWSSALNTHQRTRLKTAAMIEDWLPEAHARLHDKAETLNSKVELAKLVSRIGGMGIERADVAGRESEKISVTINLGGTTGQLKFEQPAPPRVINADD